MAFYQYLVFNGEKIPMPVSYEVSLGTVEADSGGETEAGTKQRDVIRSGIVSISVSLGVTAVWLSKLTAYSKYDKLTVKYLDTETLTLVETEMFIEDFSVSLKKDTSYKGLWEVSFRLQEF